MQKSTHVDLEVEWRWEDAHCKHVDRQYFAKANLWRDIFPAMMADPFPDPRLGAQASCVAPAGKLYEAYDPGNIKTIKNSQFNRRPRPRLQIEPRLGRFYPCNFLIHVPGINADDRRIMRIIDLDEEHIRIDLNTPIAAFAVTVSARICGILPPAPEHGGRCRDFAYDMIQGGVGMQASLADREVDFFSDTAFERLDENDDTVFYDKPRFVQHLDATARAHIQILYDTRLQPGMRVLDLMSSWVSHFQKQDSMEIIGLGLNEEELAQNTDLDRYILHDLNAQPVLPLEDNFLDAVVCTASVEYLVKPQEVFAEIARCLKPGGQCIMTFSDRWFPPKAISLWSELHPFERLGLVSVYFRASGKFKDIETLSIGHYPRPADDKYVDQLDYSDPVFAVSAIAV